MEDEAGDMMDMARCLVRLAEPQRQATKPHEMDQNYECKSCKKVFASSRALGGHRARHSHKKQRCGDQSGNTSTKMPRVHSCSVCGYEFLTGQALGGHMRKHRTKTMSFDLNLPLVEEGEDR